MIDRLELYLRWIRRRISRSEWMIRLLGLSRSEGTAAEPGLMLIQIDGLARAQLERALRRGRMPFVKRLIQRQRYRLHTHYSGLPSTTPAVQGELFYGVRAAVPAFCYYDRQCRRVFKMYNEADAEEVERRLTKCGRPLLEGGSAYSDIYTGGAVEAHFCGPTLGWNGIWRHGSPWALPLAFLLHINVLLRTAVLAVAELGLALVDCVRGLIQGQDLWKEIKFIPARVGVCVLARELVVIGAQIDLARGLPVIHVNLLGYDEQAHRRGPSSAFAHWGLSGIDGAVRRIWRAAHRSVRRHYDVWIFSDHGQEDTIPYAWETGQSVTAAVMKVYDESIPLGTDQGEVASEQRQRLRLLGRRVPRRLLQEVLAPPQTAGKPCPILTAMGPLGHLYWPDPLDDAGRAEVARRLVAEARIPLVLARDADDVVRAWSAEGAWTLPGDAAQVLGPDHPFLEDAARDLAAVCRHESAGTFVISGWRPRGKPLSFPVESGSHGGPGRHETQGFALLPPDAPLPAGPIAHLRPELLHETAMLALGRAPWPDRRSRARLRRPRDTVRIMTYNVHSCIGMDGKLSPLRIARIIARHDPDIVCLQELDVGRVRTGGNDQAHLIARELEMDHHFHAALQVEEERYGDAILSRFPMHLVRAEALPGIPGRPGIESRGALWATVLVHGIPLQVITTHLGLRVRERRRQIMALLGEHWLADARCTGPVVLCGDLNALPHSAVCRLLGRHLCDAQCQLDNHRPRKTWFGRYPLGRIDHVFISPRLRVAKIRVTATELARSASDHLPLIVDLKLES